MDILKALADWLLEGVKWVVDLLPDSPFRVDWIPDIVHQVMGYLNYFIPVGLMLKTMLAWTVVVGLWYVYSLLMRWLKAIE